MFSTPIFAPRHQTQENKDIISRKPGITNSARKPLGERSVNLVSSEKKPSLLKPGPPKLRIKSTPDICPFKDNQADSLKNIKVKPQCLSKIDFINSLNPIGTPSPKEDVKLMPEVLEMPPTETVPDFYDDTCTFNFKDENAWPSLDRLDTIEEIVKAVERSNTPPPPKANFIFPREILEIPRSQKVEWLPFEDDIPEEIDQDVTIFPDFDNFLL